MFKKFKLPKHRLLNELKGLGISLGIIAIATLQGMVFHDAGFSNETLIALYILAVMLSAVIGEGRAKNLISSFVGVFTYNFFFIEPKYTLWAYDSNYLMTFIVMFTVSFLSGSLTYRLKITAKEAAKTSRQTQMLLDTSRMLNKARGRKEIAALTGSRLHKILNMDVLFTFLDSDEPLRLCYPASAERHFGLPMEVDAFNWVYKTCKVAGAATEVYPGAGGLYYPIALNGHTYGVIGIMTGPKGLDVDSAKIVESVVEECTLMIENMRITAEKEEEKLKTKNEQFRANLLRAISHDLRTPLTSISGNASNLMSSGNGFDDKAKLQMYTDIYDDAMWLDNLVENILAISRVEEGKINLHCNTELLDDIITEALKHIDRRSRDYKIKVNPPKDLILVQIDVHLIIQVIINIINNSIKYSPVGSEITISSWKNNDKAFVKIEDNGPGIDEEYKPHIFEMFYNGAKQIADSRRSLGLGLALCKLIVTAHGGTIKAEDNNPHGTVMTFSIPFREIKIDEQ
ncbi:two-component system, OmpR family, sensor histidine kinase KdpD [Lachnospiraceae bacterium KH1T2]|nr:two-component system, OmpR family, sensor histidine kinase KdpD [Lachnospiraceae bacterium KH1T2]